MNTEELLKTGQYKKLVHLFDDNKYNAHNEVEMSHIVIALCRLGRLPEAFAVWKSLCEKESKENPQAIYLLTYFYFVIESTRTPDNLNYRDFFFRKLLSSRHFCRPLGTQARYFLLQSTAFMRYFKGKYKKAESSALLALEFALVDCDYFYAYLSFDLAGHSAFQEGYIDRGFAHLKRASHYALLSNRNREINAIKICITSYEAYFGYNADNIISDLQLCLTKNCEDSYTYASVYIELIYQFLIRGHFDEAEKYLKDSEPFFQSVNNKNIEFEYNFLSCLLLILKGKELSASKLFQDCFTLQTVNKSDKNAKILLLSKLLSIFTKFKKYKDIKTSEKSSCHFFEDLMTQCINKNETILETAEKSNYLSLIKIYFRLDSKKIHILPNIFKDKLFCCIDEHIYLKNVVLTKIQIQFLRLILKNQKISKEDLIRELWNYNYNPNKHDKLIYPMISRLKKALGEPIGRLLHSEAGYYSFKLPLNLQEGVNAEIKSDDFLVRNISEKNSNVLNFRQFELLGYLSSVRWIDCASYQKHFNVSRATATRDLVQLKDLNYLQSFGIGRGIKYKKI